MDDQALPVDTPDLDESLLHSLEQAAKDIGLYVNSDKTEFICFNHDDANFSLNGNSLK